MNTNIKKIRLAAYTKLFCLPIVLGLCFFLPAGTFDYWQAWSYIAVIFVPAFFVVNYLIIKDPELMERRLQFKEKEDSQKKIIKYGPIIYIFVYLIPGFDKRFLWSEVPFWLNIVSDILVFTGYLIVAIVLKQNSFASRIIEVSEGQKVITNGLYSIVRHPMYAGVLIMMCFTPLALGSFWALIPSAAFPVILVMRIINEEKVLKEGLNGYNEYCGKTKYRLIPYIW